MGCCQARDETNSLKRPSMAPELSKSSLYKDFNSESSYYQPAQETFDTETPFQARHADIEGLIHKQDWANLTEALYSEHTADVGAENPKILGCHCISVLCEELKKGTSGVLAYLSSIIGEILNFIRNRGDDMRENCVMLLFEYVGRASTLLIEDLLMINAFEVLVRWMNCSNRELRMTCAKICQVLYKRQKIEQDQFIALKGHFKLVQLLVWSTGSEVDLMKILCCIEDLIFVCGKTVRLDVCSQLQSAMAVEAIRDLIGAKQSLRVLSKAIFLKRVIVND